jgi:hypothetical protein
VDKLAKDPRGDKPLGVDGRDIECEGYLVMAVEGGDQVE